MMPGVSASAHPGDFNKSQAAGNTKEDKVALPAGRLIELITPVRSELLRKPGG